MRILQASLSKCQVNTSKLDVSIQHNLFGKWTESQIHYPKHPAQIVLAYMHVQHKMGMLQIQDKFTKVTRHSC